MPSRLVRIGRIERAVAELRTPEAIQRRAAETLDAAGWPDCPIADRWLAGDRTLAPMIVTLGPRLVATVSEAELRL